MDANGSEFMREFVVVASRRAMGMAPKTLVRPDTTVITDNVVTG